MKKSEVQTTRKLEIVEWKKKQYFLIQETENYIMVSANGKSGFFSIVKKDINLKFKKNDNKLHFTQCNIENCQYHQNTHVKDGYNK